MSSNYTKQQEGLATCWLLSLVPLSTRSTSAKTEGKNTTSDKRMSRSHDVTSWMSQTGRCCDGLLCQRGWCCAQLVSAAVAAVARRLMICFLPFDLAKAKGRPNSRRGVPSFDTAKGKGRPPRGSRCRFIKMANGQSCEAVGLGRSSVQRSPMFSRLHAQPGAAPCVSPRDHG
jgi:hypothetical protein